MRESRSPARCKPGLECVRLAHRPCVEPAKLANRTEGRSLRGTPGPTSHERAPERGSLQLTPWPPARAVTVGSRALRESPQPTVPWCFHVRHRLPMGPIAREGHTGDLQPATGGCSSAWHRRELANESPGMFGSCGYTRTRPSPSSQPRCRSPERRVQVHKTHRPRQRGEARPLLAVGRDPDRHGRSRWCSGWPGGSSRRILVAITSPPADPGPDPPDASTDGACTSPPRAPLRSAQEVMTEPGGVQQGPDLLRERSGPPRHRGRGRRAAVDPGPSPRTCSRALRTPQRAGHTQQHRTFRSQHNGRATGCPAAPHPACRRTRTDRSREVGRPLAEEPGPASDTQPPGPLCHK